MAGVAAAWQSSEAATALVVGLCCASFIAPPSLDSAVVAHSYDGTLQLLRLAAPGAPLRLLTCSAYAPPREQRSCDGGSTGAS